MIRKIKTIIVLGILLVIAGCDNGVEVSPQPGLIRVVLETADDNTFIVERGDTSAVFTPTYCEFYVSTGQGSAFQGENFSILFPHAFTTQQYDTYTNLLEMNFHTKIGDEFGKIYFADTTNIFSKEDFTEKRKNYITKYVRDLRNDILYGNITYNDIKDVELREFVKQTIDVSNGTVELGSLKANYKRNVVFESYTPPGNYDSLKFSVSIPNSSYFRKIRIPSITGTGEFENDLQIANDENSIMNFDVKFEVEEGKVTEIVFKISPLESISRFLDSYLFDRKVEVLEVKNAFEDNPVKPSDVMNFLNGIE